MNEPVTGERGARGQPPVAPEPRPDGGDQKKARTRAEEKLRAFHEEDAIEKVQDFGLVRRLWPFLRPHARFVAWSLFALLLLSTVSLVRPVLMGDLVARAGALDQAGLVRDGLLLSLLLVGSQLLTFLQTYMMQLGGARAMADLREHVFAHLQRLRLRYFDRTPVGRLVTRVTSDVDAVSEVFASGVLNAIGDLVQLVGIVTMMLVLDWRLSLIAFAALPVVGAVVNVVRQRSRRAFREVRVKTARLNAFLNEQVSGIAVVQAYGREKAMASEFDETNEAYRDANKRSIFYEAVLDAAIEMVATVCIASILWWSGVQKLGAHVVSFATVVTFTQYVKQFFEPVSLLAQRYMILQGALTGAERIFRLLDETDVEGGDAVAAGAASAGSSDEALRFDHVTFGYKPGAPVLRGVNLTVRRGEKVALVGATGAGKTTVASLALNLYEVDAGVVRVLGQDVRTADRRALRQSFAVVPQDVFLFSGTITSNVAMSDGSPDVARVRQALERVGALELFAQRPGGIEAPVDERGANFSAGERQLIAFARAIYRDAPILVLDEATASIDSDTESRLQVALAAVMEGRTAIVIAHRLSTIRAVDRIVVFHKGHIVEEGSHDDLLARGGVYARLHRLQFAQERSRTEAPLGAEGELEPRLAQTV